MARMYSKHRVPYREHNPGPCVLGESRMVTQEIKRNKAVIFQTAEQKKKRWTSYVCPDCKEEKWLPLRKLAASLREKHCTIDKLRCGHCQAKLRKDDGQELLQARINLEKRRAAIRGRK